MSSCNSSTELVKKCQVALEKMTNVVNSREPLKAADFYSQKIDHYMLAAEFWPGPRFAKKRAWAGPGLENSKWAGLARASPGGCPRANYSNFDFGHNFCEICEKNGLGLARAGKF